MKIHPLELSVLLLAACSRSGAADTAGVVNAMPVAAAQAQQEANPIDFRISDDVRQAFVGDRQLAPESGAMNVSTQDGVVTLRGFVSADALKQRASVVANAVGSVVRVDNQLTVDAVALKTQEPMELPIDHIISDRVRQALFDDRTLAADAANVRVHTQDGVVGLSGAVSSEAVKTRMAVVANAVGSVKRVVNQLRVNGK